MYFRGDRERSATGRFGSVAVSRYLTTWAAAFERLAIFQNLSKSKTGRERLLSPKAVIQTNQVEPIRTSAFGQKKPLTRR